MKLYYLQGACSLAVHIVLEWCAQPYEAISVSGQALKEPDFLALNPLGSAPVFIDSNIQLTQSSAILQYLAEKHPESQLLGTTLVEKAETRRWLGLINADIHPLYSIIFGVKHYINDENCHTGLKHSATERIKKMYVVIDKQLQGNTYLTGNRSIADAFLFVTLLWAPVAKIDIASLPALQQFFEGMKQDAGVIAALQAEGLADRLK